MMLIQYQVPLILACFAAGSLCVGFILRKPSGHRAWLVADLVWVVLGLFGTLLAILAGHYMEDSSRIDRQINLAQAASTRFDDDAARFRLRHCTAPGTGTPVATLCEKVEFLSASTARNADLPLFLKAAEGASPLLSLSLFGTPGQMKEEAGAMQAAAARLSPATLLSFSADDEKTREALGTITTARPEIAGDYRILARSYEGLITEITRLKAEWERLQATAWILAVQILAISMVAFAAPFRLGKAVADLRR
ncbi:MAG: hypothetical protein RIG84_00825 [Roseovarius sp.]